MIHTHVVSTQQGVALLQQVNYVGRLLMCQLQVAATFKVFHHHTNKNTLLPNISHCVYNFGSWKLS